MQTLFNKDYTFYSGSVVNNPHGYGIHAFAGAYPPATFHFKQFGPADPPFAEADNVVKTCVVEHVLVVCSHP